ncbi:MAG: O-antigen ligase family protein [Eubacteriales bacterium]|nr:O-antigen ligase family protein [Eubacteriales bacterium]
MNRSKAQLFADTLFDPRWLKYLTAAVGVACVTPYGGLITSVTNKLFILWGVLIVAWDTFSHRRWMRAGASALWCAALLMGGVTAALAPHKFSNLAGLGCNGVLFAVFFAADLTRAQTDIRREIRVLSHILLALCAVVCAVSLVKGFWQINKPLLGYPQGMVQSSHRLWGWASNANTLGQAGWVGAMASLLAAALCPAKKARWWYALPAALCVWALALSDSRGSMVALMVFAALTVFFAARSALRRAGKPGWVGTVAAVGAGLLVAGGLYGAQIVMQKTYQPLALAIDAARSGGEGRLEPDVALENLNNVQDETLGGELPGRGSLTSGRAYLWKTGLLVWARRPLLGVGNANIYDQTMAVGSLDPRAHLHNGYLQVLVADGLVGLLLLLSMAVFALRCWLRARKNAQGNALFFLVVSLCVSVAVANLVESTFYDSLGLVTVVFWCFLGYSLSLSGDAAAGDASVEALWARFRGKKDVC